jgi:photosystem II stability/assembly factor-like uncharacterized protein
MKINSDNPVEIYSSTDTIRYIYITKNNTILAFKGGESSWGYNTLRHEKYFSTRSIIRSIDEGKSWLEIPVKLSGDTKILEKDTGKIYLYASHYSDQHSDSNIYYSENDGKSWITLNWNFGLIRGMSVINDGNILVSNDSLIYISKDNGKSWSIHSKIILPIDLSTLYENSKGQLIVKYPRSWNRDFSDMYSSTDRGITWKQIFLTDTSKQGIAYRGQIKDTTIYAIDRNFQFFRSDDLGNSWTYLNDFTNELKDSSMLRYYSIMNINDKIYIFKPSNIIFQYDEIENKLKLINKSKAHVQYFSYRDEDVQLLMSDYETGEINRIENINLIEKKTTNSIYVYGDIQYILKRILSPKNKLILHVYDYNDNRHQAVYSDNNAFTFHEYKDSIMFGAFFLGNKGELYSAYRQKLYVSYDEGMTFSIFLDTIPIQPSLGGMSPVGNMYFFGSNGDYAWTSDQGKTWTSKYEYWFSSPREIKFRQNGDIVYGNYLVFWLSTDFGVNWTQIGENCSDFGMCDMSQHPDGDLFFVHDRNLLRKSKDNGKTWEQLIYVSDFGLNGSIHITNTGLIFAPPYFSSDNGLKWIDSKVSGKVESNNNGLILLVQYSSYYGGDPVFYKFNSPNGIEDEYPKNSENLISPNPASDFIEISVGANGRSPLQSEVRIYNVFGQNVSSTRAGLEPAPTIRIDVSGLPPGMYFVMIGDKVGKFVKI